MGETLTSTVANPFKAVKTQKVSTLIAEQIVTRLESGDLRPGDRLPPERQLAEQFAVNRQAVREALSALQLLGVIQTRPGSGSVVSAPTSRKPDLFSAIRKLDEEDNPFEIMEVRGVIEPEIARLAALRADRSQVKKIQTAIDEYAATVQNSQTPPAGDLRIHIALAHASGNLMFDKLLEVVLGSADQLLFRLQREQKWNQARARLFLGQHRRILNAIKARDPRTAVRVMRQHLRASHWQMPSKSDEV